MKVLLDVCTPVQVRQALPGHEVHTTVKMGWGEFGNGRLLQVAESSGFDLFIICDKNLRDQQNLAGPTFGHSRTLDQPPPYAGAALWAHSAEC